MSRPPARMVHPMLEDDFPARRRVKVQRPHSQASVGGPSSSATSSFHYTSFSSSSSSTSFHFSSARPSRVPAIPGLPPSPSHRPDVFAPPVPQLPPLPLHHTIGPRLPPVAQLLASSPHSFTGRLPQLRPAPSNRPPLHLPVPRPTSYGNMSSPVVIDLTRSSSPPAGAAGPSRTRSRPRPQDIIDVDALPDLPNSEEADDEMEMIIVPPGTARNGRGRFQGRMQQNRTLPPPPPENFLRNLLRPQNQLPLFEDDGIHDLLNVEEFSDRPRGQGQEDPILGNGGRIGQRSPNMRPNAAFFFEPLQGVSLGGYMGDLMAARAHQRRPPRPFHQPNMDYSAQAPGILRGSPQPDAAAIRMADYKAPAPARDGFTRSPKGNDTLVCICCDQELAVEKTDLPKSGEVWAGKCGHCYCGVCATEIRTPGVSPSGKRPRTRTSPCRVTGCRTNLASKTGMFKIHI